LPPRESAASRLILPEPEARLFAGGAATTVSFIGEQIIAMRKENKEGVHVGELYRSVWQKRRRSMARREAVVGQR
jgi:hypothetical protein